MSTLIYDKSCPYCYAVSIGASKLSGIKILPLQDEKSQKMLDEAFDEPRFTLYLFEEDKVYWGGEAAKKATSSTFLPVQLFLSVLRLYPYLVKPFSVLRSKIGVEQSVCDSDRCMATEKSGGMKKLKKRLGDEKLLEFVS